MGINKTMYRLLLEIKKDYGLKGSVMQLGVMSVMFNFKDFKKINKKAGFPNQKEYQIDGYENIYRDRPTDYQVFDHLGFTSINSIDISNYEGSTHVHNLNYPIPENLRNSQDAIFDGGTTEHIFNSLQVLENLHSMLKIQGMIIHITPANNWVDHGFYQFSPTFFLDYYEANNYEIIHSYVLRSFKSKDKKNHLFKYESVALEKWAFGGWGNAILNNWFVVRKNPNSTSGVIPEQSRYKQIFWNEKDDEITKSFRGKVVKLVRRSPKFRYCLVRIRRFINEIRFKYSFLRKPKYIRKV